MESGGCALYMSDQKKGAERLYKEGNGAAADYEYSEKPWTFGM